MFSCCLVEFKVIGEDCDGETTAETPAAETPAADTEQEMADEKQKSESAQEDSSKKKKRKLNEAGDPTNICEYFLGSCNTACHYDTQLEYCKLLHC